MLLSLSQELKTWQKEIFRLSNSAGNLQFALAAITEQNEQSFILLIHFYYTYIYWTIAFNYRTTLVDQCLAIKRFILFMKQNTRMSRSMFKLQLKIYGYERKAFPCSFSHDSQTPVIPMDFHNALDLWLKQ